MRGNKVAGSGQYEHEVPSEPWQVVRVCDANHEGTDVYLEGDGRFVFVSLDMGSVSRAARCVLVRLTDVDANALQEPCGVDLDRKDGLALLGLDGDDTPPGEILWDSDE